MSGEERCAYPVLQIAASWHPNASFACLTSRHCHPCNQDRSAIITVFKWKKAAQVLRDTHHESAICHNRLCKLHVEIFLICHSGTELLLP
jgi:hypothetical protein